MADGSKVIGNPSYQNLTDLEWNIAVTAKSNNEENLGKTVVNFKMILDGNDDKRQPVHLQLKPQEFYKMLFEMERIKGNLQAFSGVES